MLTKKLKIVLISCGGALVVGGGLGVGLGVGLNQNKEEEKPKPAPFIEPDNDPCPEGECIDENTDGFCDICGYPVEIQHGITLSGDPTAPFYLKVGEEKIIKAKLSPAPSRPEEKTFTWTKSNDNGIITPDKSNTANAVVQGIQEGKVIYTATNDYNNGLVRNFTANVIDYDEDNMYLWEYQSSDRAKFGYVNKEGQKAGVTDGTATLGTIDWTFHRSETNSLQSNKGGVGFGKGKKPETLVQLTSHNDRQIKKIVVEAASANALANITVKIGDNEVINKKTPSYSEPAIGAVSYIDDEMEPKKLTGDISIQFDTPEYDTNKEDDPSYKAPGAVYLKSIWIEYYEYDLDWKTNETYDFEAMYLSKTEPFEALTGSAKPINFIDEEHGIQIKFAGVKNPATDGSGIQDFALTNGDIEVISTKSDEVIKKVSFVYQNGSTPPTYEEYTSVFGGEPYTELLDSVKGGKKISSRIGRFIYADNVSAVKFMNSPGKTTHNNVGIKSIQVKTIAKNQLQVKKLELGPNAELNKTVYKVGETFDPAGLQTINVSFTDETAPIVSIPASALEYYDAPTYDEKGEYDTFLKDGTTEVVGFLNGVEIRIGGIEVVLVKMIFEKVTDLSQIDETSRYLITSPANSSFALGTSGSNLNKGDGSHYDPDIVFGEDMFIPDSFENDLFTIEVNKNANTFKFATFDKKHTWGVTKSGSASASYTTEYTQWNFEFLAEPEDEEAKANFIPGTLKITMEVNEANYCLYNTGETFNVYKNKDANKVSNIVLYKLTSIYDPRIA